MSPLGFKARVGSALFAFCGGKCNEHSTRSTSGATHADQHAAGHFPTCMCRGGTWVRSVRAVTRTEDERAKIVPATRLQLAYLKKYFDLSVKLELTVFELTASDLYCCVYIQPFAVFNGRVWDK